MTEPTVAERIEQVAAAHLRMGRLAAGRSLRTVITDSESADGVAYTCADPGHPAGEEMGVYDCCDTDVIETRSEALAAFIAAAANQMPHLLAELSSLRSDRNMLAIDAAGGMR